MVVGKIDRYPDIWRGKRGVWTRRAIVSWSCTETGRRTFQSGRPSHCRAAAEPPIRGATAPPSRSGADRAAERQATCDACGQPNTRTEIDRLVSALAALAQPCEIAFEPTGDYHRPLAYALGQAGFQLCMVSSIAVARTREALFDSWDKNDPKDAQVILHLLKSGTTQR